MWVRLWTIRNLRVADERSDLLEINCEPFCIKRQEPFRKQCRLRCVHLIYEIPDLLRDVRDIRVVNFAYHVVSFMCSSI